MADDKPLPVYHSVDSLDQKSGSSVIGTTEAITGAIHRDLFSKGASQAFETDSLESFYKPVDGYEGLHRYDPSFSWAPEEERRLVRRIDLKVFLFVAIMFFALQLDRGNISQAVAGDMLKDLHLTTDNYNTGQTIFYVSFLCAELPSQLVSKKLGPDNWIPIQMVAWSLVASCQAFLKGKSTFYTLRFLMGVCEGGFIPDCVLLLSYWYTSSELPRRLAFFWVSFMSTSIVSAFLAYGILHMNGIDGLEGWRWLFALEGTLTGLIGIFSFFYLPPSPTQTASRFRGKDGWFTEREEKILVNRILRDDPSKGDMHNRQGLSFQNFWDCLCDYHMWPVYLIGLSFLLPAAPMSSYLTLVLRGAGFSIFHTNLLSIPAYVLFIIGLLVVTWISERINDRFLLATVSQWWCIIILIPFISLPTPRNEWFTFTLSTLLYAEPYVHAIFVAITSRNAGSVRTRTTASALYNMSVQVSGIIGINVYRSNDKPYYFTANKALLGIACYNVLLMVGTKLFYVKVNAKRDKTWSAMSREEKQHYLTTTKDQGNKRLDFRFAH